MHILIGIVGIIAALGYYFFVFRRTSEAADQAIDLAQQVRGKLRRNAFRKKAEGSVLSSVEDPGTAAAVLLVKIAECKGPVIEHIKTEIVEMVRDGIGMPDADEVVPFAVWIAEQTVNPSDIIRTYRSIWMSELNASELSGFLEMGTRIANMSGKPNAEQNEILRLMRERLLS